MCTLRYSGSLLGDIAYQGGDTLYTYVTAPPIGYTYIPTVTLPFGGGDRDAIPG